MYVIISANAAWNVWNFRRGVASPTLSDAHIATFLAPQDDSVRKLDGMGRKFIPLEINAQAVNPITTHTSNTREAPPLTVVHALAMKAPRMTDFRYDGGPQTAQEAREAEYAEVPR